MRIHDLPRYIFINVVAGAIVAAGCSTNGGFGGPPGPLNGGQQYPNGNAGGSSPASSSSPGPKTSGSPTAGVPLNGAIRVAGASARLAFDASAADPQKAQRLLILTFAIKNGSSSSVTIKKLSIVGAGDLRPVSGPMDKSYLAQGNEGAKPGTRTSGHASPVPAAADVSLTIASGRQSDARVVALVLPNDVASHKQVSIDFLPAKGKLIANVTLDVPAAEVSFTPLDEKVPKGQPSVDSVDIAAVEMTGSGQHYQATFAVTNPGATPLSITGLAITPPKGTATKVGLGFALQPRTTTGFITLVVPFAGKSLPTGKYTITANGAGAAIATGSGNII